MGTATEIYTQGQISVSCTVITVYDVQLKKEWQTCSFIFLPRYLSGGFLLVAFRPTGLNDVSRSCILCKPFRHIWCEQTVPEKKSEARKLAWSRNHNMMHIEEIKWGKCTRPLGSTWTLITLFKMSQWNSDTFETWYITKASVATGICQLHWSEERKFKDCIKTFLFSSQGNLYGRGATDNKGPVLAWINAVQTFRALELVGINETSLLLLLYFIIYYYLLLFIISLEGCIYIPE